MSNGPRWRRVYALEWHHPDFRRLNAAARVVRLYVTAGPQTTSVGCFRLSTAQAVEDLGGTREEFEALLAQVCETLQWAWDPLSRVIWIRDWFASNPPASPNVVTSWARLLRNVPACPVRDEAVASITASLKNLPAAFREPWKELSKTSRRSEVHSESNQGAGNQRSGIQGEREQARFARKPATNEKTNGPKSIDPRIVKIAGETIRQAPRSAEAIWIDVVVHACSREQIPVDRDVASVALAQAQGQAATP